MLRPVSFLLSHSGHQLISRSRHSILAKSHEAHISHKTLFPSDILRRRTPWCSLSHGYSCAPALGHLLNRYPRPSQWASIRSIALGHFSSRADTPRQHSRQYSPVYSLFSRRCERVPSESANMNEDREIDGTANEYCCSKTDQESSTLFITRSHKSDVPRVI